MANYSSLADFRRSMDITDALWKGYAPGERAGIRDSYRNLTGFEQPSSNTTTYVPEYDWAGMEAPKDFSLGDLNLSSFGGALGLGQLGLGALSYLDSKKTAKKQRALMDQQLAENEAQRKAREFNKGELYSAYGLANPYGTRS